MVMDSASESLVFETVDGNEVSAERVYLVDHDAAISSNSFPHVINKFGSEGSVGGDAALAHGDATPVSASAAERDVKAVEPMNTAEYAASPASVDSSSTGKGHGLKKWRRIRRDIAKDVSASTDSNKALKRVLPAQANSDNPSSKPHYSARSLHNAETSVGSVSGLPYDGVGDARLDHGSPISSTFALAPTFVAGVDSDNSEDRSSKSSTAASVPRFKTEMPSGLGYIAEKNRVKSLTISIQLAQQGNRRLETSKKARGEWIKIEKENSHSSVESDSRSSNFVFMQAPFSATSNGKKSGTSRDYEGDYTDEVHQNDQPFCGEGQASYFKGNAENSEVHSQDDSAADNPWKAIKERRKDHHPSKDHDPLLESIASLNSVQESLEKELQKLAEIGKETFPPHFDSVNTNSQTSPESLETQVLTLTEHVEHLKAMLEESRAALRIKESQLSKLESTLCNPRKEQLSGEIDAELETLFQQRIESDVEFLAMKSTMQSLKTDKQETLQRFNLAETNAVNLKKQVEDIDSLSGDIMGVVDEVLKFQKGTWKVSAYLLLQLVLLVVVLCLFALRLSSKPTFSVPTFSVPT